MNKKEQSTLEDQGRKIDQILYALQGDEMGTYAGLIAEQKRDNSFREKVSRQLDTIEANQKEQMQINREVHQRLSSLEAFASFFQTLSKVKRSTWIIVGAVMTGLGWAMIKLKHLWDWVVEAIS